MSHFLLSTLFLLLLLLVLPGTLMLLVYSLLGRRAPAPLATKNPIQRGVILVPAHNEGQNIARTLHSLQDSAEGVADILVIADHCDDDTAQVAWAAGAQVITRPDGPRGKGAALDETIASLLAKEDGPAWFAIVDADSVVSSNFAPLLARHFAAGADAVQVNYTVLNRKSSWRARLMFLALCGFNHLRPRARQALNLSVGLFGNGFALSRETLCHVPYHAHSLNEDTEYHIELCLAGRKVRFEEQATVAAEMPDDTAAATAQRCRWEGGRLALAKQYLKRLWPAVRAGDEPTAEPLLELLTLPTASLLTGGLLLLALPLPPARLMGAITLFSVLVYTWQSARLAGMGWRDLKLLPAILHYLFWKLLLLPGIWRTARHGRWVRTPRKGEA